MHLPSLRAVLHNFFTRIFLSFWAVIVLIAASAAAVTAIDFAATPDRPSTVIRAAKEALDRDGLEGLKVWLAERNRSRPKQRTLIIDSHGREILGQRLPAFRGPGFGPGGPRRDGPAVAPGSLEFRPGERTPGADAARGSGERLPPPISHESREAAPTRGGDAAQPGLRAAESSGEAPAPDADRRPPLGGEDRPPPRGDGREPSRDQFFFRVLGGDGRWGPSIVRGKDGSVYRVIFDPPPRRGPLSPPFSGWVRAALLAVALGLSGLVSYLLARSISTPVRRLQAAAHTLSAGNLDARAGPEVTNRKDELGTLGREFDSMAERLGALIAARQRLLRDISHELRSPLARMEMAIGLARQEPATALEQLDRVQRESERLEQLIGHILEYARLERDPSTFTFEELDVADLVRQVVHDAEFESQSPPGRLRVTSADTVPYRGDAQVLHSAIDNVVRNALLHGNPQTPIGVNVEDDGDAVRISVRDCGAGVRDEDLPHIFEPFYRAGAKDSKHVSTAGTGIGLAITQRAAALHGGEVSAHNVEGGGLVVSIVLPVRGPQSPGG
jgi:signal transduction histidine kinase